MKGKMVPLSRPRRILTDLSHASLGFPRATLRTRIDIGALVAPRAAPPQGARVPWPIVFAKAFALVARDMPHLRRVYVKLPWPHFYELPTSVGSIIVERDWPEAAPVEQALFLARLKDPASAPLAESAAALRRYKTAPIDSIADFRRILALAALPLPLRRLVLFLGLNLGRQVPNYFGTFAISPLGSHGAAILDTIPVWTSFLNYGPIEPDGGVDVYLSVDHRVMDGGHAARAITAMEAVLNGAILNELKAIEEKKDVLF
jgi:hypothetical protein